MKAKLPGGRCAGDRDIPPMTDPSIPIGSAKDFSIGGSMTVPNDWNVGFHDFTLAPATTALKEVNMFSGELEFLSNSYMDPIEIPWLRDASGGAMTAPSAEHAFQASKSAQWAEQQLVLAQRTPDEAVIRGRSSWVTLQPLWDRGLRVRYMMKILNLKFAPESELGARLLATDTLLLRGTRPMSDTRRIHSQFWGNCICSVHFATSGANMLGELLMVRRETLRALEKK